jgi:hypothetical protein
MRQGQGEKEKRAKSPLLVRGEPHQRACDVESLLGAIDFPGDRQLRILGGRY